MSLNHSLHSVYWLLFVASDWIATCSGKTLVSWLENAPMIGGRHADVV